MARAKSSKKQETRGKSEDTVSLVTELAQVVETHGLSELSLTAGDLSLTLRRGTLAPVGAAPMLAPTMMQAAPAPAASASAAASKKSEGNGTGHVVTSPFVGTFYRSPSPDAEAYVDVGDKVQKGQVLCIVEAMKLMNEIEADTSGTVVECLVENNAAVEYGQPLFRIEPA